MLLQDYLESRQFTYKEFAKMADVTPQTIYNYIHGRRKPTLEVALRIEEATKGKVSAKDLNQYRKENKKNG